ncbi:MAG: cation transporter [Candidatus Nitrohelix vancouverensis]|uniref:Cation transporter n=1 Tax=Candidatus Nitrohelix vancouverensis TaxID=2705534 RepID=A0A7T0G250_9BACT|nr:MAG: cation transporter [Candidatus Nitrohelix vancouverensis]
MIKSLKQDLGIRAIAAGVIGNVILSIIKFIAGILGNSAAMIADAVHSLSDLLTDGVAGFTYKISQIPKDENHPYGHGRAETLGSVLIGIIIAGVGVGLVFEAWEKIASDTLTPPTWLALGAAVVSIAIKEGLFHYTLRIGDAMNSPSLKANAWHHRSDAVSSFAALLGIGGAMAGFPILDPIAAGAVSLMIFYAGYKICAQGVNELMDESIGDETLARIEDIVRNTQGIVDFHELRTRTVGGEIFLDVNILVSPRITVSEGHHIAETLRRSLINEFENLGEALIHVDAEDDSSIESINNLSREEIESYVDPILKEEKAILQKTGMHVHYLKGKHTLEIKVRVTPDKTVAEIKTIFNDLRTRLRRIDRVGDARLYVDTASEESSGK